MAALLKVSQMNTTYTKLVKELIFDFLEEQETWDELPVKEKKNYLIYTKRLFSRFIKQLIILMSVLLFMQEMANQKE